MEDEFTVSCSTLLRAATYVAENGETIKPFKATLFNYDVDTINQYIANQEVADAVAKGVNDFSNWEWQGLYFSNGNPGKNNDNDPGYYTGSYTSETSSYQAASSVTYRDLANSNVTNAATNYYYKSGSSYYPVTVTRTRSTESSDIYINQGRKAYRALYFSSNTYYYLDTATCQYYPLTITLNSNRYTIQYTQNGSAIALVDNKKNATASFDVYTKSTGGVTKYTYTLYANGKIISTNTVTDTSATYSANTLYVRSAGTTYSATSSSYADWNYWPDNLTAFSSNAAYRSYIYSGLVTNQLDENGNIQFTTTSANIFDASDTFNKEIYTNVGIPFYLRQLHRLLHL